MFARSIVKSVIREKERSSPCVSTVEGEVW